MNFGTKSETLLSLVDVIQGAKVLPILKFTVKEWFEDSDSVLDRLFSEKWTSTNLIVRSSALSEDSSNCSLAGHFTSILGVSGRLDVKNATDEVCVSLKDDVLNQIFIQPMLSSVKCSGVAFTRDPNGGGHYYVINYDQETGRTDSVTAGDGTSLRTTYIFKGQKSKQFIELIDLLKELEIIFETDCLDVEFAYDNDGQLFLFQVRPLILSSEYSHVSFEDHKRQLDLIYQTILKRSVRHPYLYGNRGIFGVMPDWNPAEIIGIKPKPFAISLYKELVTDSMWAYQRDNYGYRNLRSFPLLLNFGGLPYIDVRVSFNSFIPSQLNSSLADKLVNYYLQRLVDKPELHDKVEFEIIYSCYTLDLPQRINQLLDYGFTDDECHELKTSLKELTNRIIHAEEGLWKKDIDKIHQLESRRDEIYESDLDIVSKIYWLLEDCKRYGTLPFAGLARAGFIAVQLLKSLMNSDILSAKDYDCFMASLSTVSSQMGSDLVLLSRTSFLKRYGHLRPGTYDVLSHRYDSAPDLYFDWNQEQLSEKEIPFALSLKQLNNLKELLNEHGLEHDVLSLFNFIKQAIEGREYAKFVFSRSLSDAMELFVQLCADYGFEREESCYADISLIRELYSSSCDIKQLIQESINSGKVKFDQACPLSFPPLLCSPKEIYEFTKGDDSPNYITLKNVTAPKALVCHGKEHFENNILMIPSADPGYDWVFSHKIAGLITMYGGANSHMAIRAGELGIPAAIGAGQSLYNKLEAGEILELDCAARVAKVLK